MCPVVLGSRAVYQGYVMVEDQGGNHDSGRSARARSDAPPAAGPRSSARARPGDITSEGDVASPLDAAASGPPDSLLRRVAGGRATTPSPPLSAGDRLGQFTVVHELGRGGMGVVYLARDLTLGRSVALKVLPSSVSGDVGRRRRLIREARASAQLDHPNIARVYEAGEADGRLYIAMEYVDGTTLRARLHAGPLPLAEALGYTRQVLAGLSAAHGAGLVHRDLKPDNVMVTAEGSVRLLDFGLAKRVDAAPSPRPEDELTSWVSQDGALLGTPAYMSPEQAAGDAVDERSDLFSLGVMLHELLAGQRPFGGTTRVGLMQALMAGDAPPLRGVDERVAAVVQRCLAKSREARYSSAAEVLHALEGLERASTPVVATTPPTRDTAWRAAALVASVLGASGVLLLAARGSDGPDVVRTEQAPSRHLAGTSTTATLGANGAACRTGEDCVSGGCVLGACKQWVLSLEGQGADGITDVVVLLDGSLAFAGYFAGYVDLGCGPLNTPSAEPDLVVARFRRNGVCLWARRFGGDKGDGGGFMSVTPDGHLLLSAIFSGTMEVGGQTFTSRGNSDILVLELDDAGRPLSTLQLGSELNDYGGVLLGPDGSRVFYGLFTSPALGLGAHRLLNPGSPGNRLFVAKLDAAGKVLWARTFDSSAAAAINFAALDRRGNLGLHGAFQRSIDFGAGPLVSAGGTDTFLVVLSGVDGAPVWQRGIGTVEDEPYEGGVVFAEDGSLLVAGEHRGADLGGGKLPGTIYVARYDARGAHVWSRGYGGGLRDHARRVALDGRGDLVVLGRLLSAEVMFEGRTLTNRGGSDMFVGRFEARTGALLGVVTYFATDAPTRALAVDPVRGNVLVAGRFVGTMDFGDEALEARDQDGYLASLGPVP